MRPQCDSWSAGTSNPHGANVEVKVIDPSANPYLATAAILGLALDGIEQEVPLPAEATVDPSSLTEKQRVDAGIAVLPTSQSAALDALENSARMRGILGDQAVDAILAVRRYEQENFGDLDDEALAEKFRMAWSL